MNKFFKVISPIKVKVFTGVEHHNEYYGAAKILRPVQEEIELEADDEVHLLQGGNFAVQLFNDGTAENPGTSYKVYRMPNNYAWVAEPEKVLGSLMATPNYEEVDYSEAV